MLAVLSANNITAKRVSENTGYRITVDGSDLARATVVLKDTGYPRETFRSLAEVFPADGLIITPFEQKARMTFALGQELSRTISSIEGVTQARVHVVLPETDLRDRNTSRSSAAIVVHHRSGIDVGDLTQKARLIVTNGVPGLALKDVSVSTFTASQKVSSRSVDIAQGGSDGFASSLPLRLDWILLGLAAIAAVVGLGALFGRNKRA
jgi:type III secretion protein J